MRDVLACYQFADQKFDLAAFDCDRGGYLRGDELRRMMSMYHEAKLANATQSIAMSTLPANIRADLKVFDADGDGLIDSAELAHAAKLYAESKNSVRPLIQDTLASLAHTQTLTAADMRDLEVRACYEQLRKTITEFSGAKPAL